MDLNIKLTTVKTGTLGHTVYQYFQNNKKKTTIEITLTKGKIELETENIERINFYKNSIIIIYKDRTQQFVNLLNVTQILWE